MMDLARAKFIVKAINDRALAHVGVERALDSLKAVSLSDMIEAKRIVLNANEAAESAAAITGETYTVTMTPDDRLIAAVYCLDHFPASNEPVLQIPEGDHHQRCVAVVRIKAEVETDNEDEQEDA